KIDWYSKRHMFYVVSLVLTLGGMAVFIGRDKNDLYDIEFLGGTAVQADLKPEMVGKVTRDDVEKRLAKAGDEMKALADKVAEANVTRQGSDFVVAAPGVPWDRLMNIIAAQISNQLPQNGIREAGPNQVTVRLKDGAKLADKEPSVDSMKEEL